MTTNFKFNLLLKECPCKLVSIEKSGTKSASLATLYLFTALTVSTSALAEEISTAQSASIESSPTEHQMSDHNHGNAPAGVHGAELIGSGSFGFSYTPMFMHMSDNYIGSSTVSSQTIVTTIPSQMTMANGMGMPMAEMYRVVPTSMDTQSHMFNFMYGVNESLNLMIMASYQQKSMTMTTYSGSSGTTVLGSSLATTLGLGDTAISSLWRIFKDTSNDANLNFGVSLPTGSRTENITMLSPMLGAMNMPMYMSMRASYGMQLGTGTYDVLSGLTFLNHTNKWTWGAAWRGRFALGNNTEGYHYGDLNEVTGWGGYTYSPGLTWSARIVEGHQNQIHGSDPMITGLMQGTNPSFYGGTHTDLLGGVEIAGGPWGFKNKHLALEAGETVIQNLYGPQLGRSWVVNLALGASL
jgi:hypothetical protein